MSGAVVDLVCSDLPPSLGGLMYPMALLLQGRGYNLRRGVHFRDGGTSACSHEGGTGPIYAPHTSVGAGEVLLSLAYYLLLLLN